jgi:predicted DNA-binding transcriptional regulator AlpA
MTRPDEKTRIRKDYAMAVDANRLAALLDLSLRTVRRLDSSGKLPRPVRIGGAVRWRLNEIEAWLEAGCPDRQRWDATKRHNGESTR